jgi:hypothetical protein
MDRWMGR